MRVLLALCLAIFVLFSYQNCGQGFRAVGAWEGSSSSGDDGLESGEDDGEYDEREDSGSNLVVKYDFEEGDDFDYELLYAKQMIVTLINELNYHTYDNGKSIAINSRGLGFVSLKISGETEAVRTALEGCYILGGREPCVTLAAGDEFAISSDDLFYEDSFTFELRPLNDIDPDSNPFPFVRETTSQTITDRYDAATSPKALAMSVEGTYVISPSNVATLAEAERLAMERCEMQAAITPCILVARDSTAVFDPEEELELKIDYKRSSVMINLPGTGDDPYQQIVQDNYLVYLDDNPDEKGAIYISAMGAGAVNYGANQAEVDDVTRQSCEDNNTSSTHTCFKYAEGKDILLLSDNLYGYKSYREIHCRTVPRQSCDAHADVGCGVGDRYVYRSNGDVELTLCD